MRHFELYPDYETSEHAGAGGTFQIIQLKEDGKDVTHLVDQGIHFHDTAEVERYLSKTLGEQVSVEKQG